MSSGIYRKVLLSHLYSKLLGNKLWRIPAHYTFYIKNKKTIVLVGIEPTLPP